MCLHTGFDVAGNAAVETVAAGRGRREERQGGLARRHRSVDVQCIDVEATGTGVPVSSRSATVWPTLARSSDWSNRSFIVASAGNQRALARLGQQPDHTGDPGAVHGVDPLKVQQDQLGALLFSLMGDVFDGTSPLHCLPESPSQ
jgi:hypothetical protein